MALLTHNSFRRQAYKFNGDVGRWNTSRLQSARTMFGDCRLFNRNVSGWDTTLLVDAAEMFDRAETFNQNLCRWGDRMTNLTDVRGMFSTTSCYAEGDPTFTPLIRGPFCWDCPSTRPKLTSHTYGPVKVPLVPGSMSNLPDGRILMWAGERPNQVAKDRNYPEKLSGTYTSIFDPSTGNATLRRVERTF
jgi:Mycoplasma protein of unknown function, DUF285